MEKALLCAMLKYYQDARPEQWMKYCSPTYQTSAEDFAVLLLRSRGQTVFTAEILWKQWMDTRRELRKTEPIWFSL